MMMTVGKRKNQGYTLLELLAALAIIGTVMAALGGLLLSGLRACQRVDNRSEVQENGRVGLEMMTRDIKSCRSIVQVNTDSFSLLGSDGSSVRYQVSSGTLYRSAKGASNPICNKVTGFAVTEVFPDLLAISLTTGEQEFSYELTTQVKRMTD